MQVRLHSDRPVTVAGRVHAYPLPADERQEISSRLPERLRALAVNGSCPQFGRKNTFFKLETPKHEYTSSFGDTALLPVRVPGASVSLPFYGADHVTAALFIESLRVVASLCHVMGTCTRVICALPACVSHVRRRTCWLCHGASPWRRLRQAPGADNAATHAATWVPARQAAAVLP